MPDQLRHHHVLKRREFWQQVVELEDESEGLVPQPVALRLSLIVDPGVFEKDFAGIGAVEKGASAGAITVAPASNAATANPAKRLAAFDLPAEPACGGGSIGRNPMPRCYGLTERRY